MADDPRTELDRLIQDLERMEHAEGFATEAAGMLHAARTILLEVALITLPARTIRRGCARCYRSAGGVDVTRGASSKAERGASTRTLAGECKGAVT